MKICLLVLVLLISPCELRQRNNDDYDNDEIYQLDELLNEARHALRPSKQQQYDDDNGDDDQFIPSFSEHKKKNPSRKKVLQNDDEESSKSSESDPGVCVEKYSIQSEQLVKVKELTNGAHMLRFVLLDKRTISSIYNLKQHCMIKCCEQSTCDLAMLSEQATHVNLNLLHRSPNEGFHISRKVINVIYLLVMVVVH